MGTITFVSTTVVNVPLGVWKDISFAQIYGASSLSPEQQLKKLKSRVPRSATATFLFRDSLTIFGSFTLAPSMSAMIPDSLTTNHHAKAMITQLTVPVLSQLAATPVHLVGLDLYNRPGASVRERALQVRRDIVSATFVRCLRIIPAFGFGCIANLEARAALHGIEI